MRLVDTARAHPGRAAAAILVAAIGLAAFWYLASPLWVRTYREEALPSVVGVPTAAPLASPAAGNVPPAATAVATEPRVLLRGQLGFVDQAHNGRGEVRVLQAGTATFVRFESVAITNAPDLHVYLSPDTGGKWAERTSLYLGPLKATNGSFNYELPAGTALAPYKSVVVWCRAFSVLVTWADLS